MAEVKWIKITTNMFDDEKIKIIESMPEKDSILIVWIKLLTLAGKINANGYIFLTENIPYTDEMLATVFNRPLNVVRMALEIFKKFKMIDYNDNDILHITNWDKYQNIYGLDKIREQTRLRVAKYRKKLKELPASNVTGNVTVTLRNAIEEEKEEDIDIDKDINKILLPEGSNSSSSYSDEEFREIANIYQQTIGVINELTSDWLQAILDDYGFEWCKEAMMEADKQGKRSKKYVEGILQNWKTSGGMKLSKDKDRNKDKQQTKTDYDEASESKYGW